MGKGTFRVCITVYLVIVHSEKWILISDMKLKIVKIVINATFTINIAMNLNLHYFRYRNYTYFLN